MECIDNRIVENGNGVINDNEIESPSLLTPPSTRNVNNGESNPKISDNATIPQLLVTDCSPNQWEPQIVEHLADISVQTSPGAYTDKSLSNSYVTAKDKLTPDPSSDFSFGNSNENNSITGNSDSSYVTKSSLDQPFETISSNSSTEDGTMTSDRGSSSINSSTTSPSVENFNNISSPLVVTSKSTHSVNVTTPKVVSFECDDHSLSHSINSSQRETTDQFGDCDEDYFEEYHLPNTHENAFVRHLSFRRKVQTTPINAPDAERIEGLVRTGEFVRHGSIRRKILPEEEEFEEDYEDEDVEDYYGEHEDKNSSSFTDRIDEIERYLSDENLNEYPSLVKSTPARIKNMKRTASTPKTNSDTNGETLNVDLSINAGLETSSEIFQENVSIEASTLRKIQECLDFSSYKDMLNLSGRLSDLLSPQEVVEVLNHSERYRQYLNTEVFEALSLSFQDQSHSLPCTINLLSNSESAGKMKPNSNSAVPNTDNGFSCTKTPKGDEAKRIESTPQNDLHLVERRGAACDGIGAQGIFVETRGATPDLRKISAPQVNLDWSSESKYDDSDLDTSEDKNIVKNPPRKRISVTQDILDITDAIDVGSEAIEKDIDNYGEANDSHTTLGSETDIPPHTMSIIPPPPDLIPELTAAEEMSEVRHWRNVVIGGAWRRIDMKAIAPFRKCISHGGYMDDSSQSPIVVISAALLPDKSRKDYDYVMDNLFMYVLSFLEQLVADDYVLIYFSGGRLNGAGPGFHWMRRAYEMIDRRLRKNLKSLLVVHPSLWAKTILTLSRPFISSKFYCKVRFVNHLTDLAMMVPLEQLEIPDAVKQLDFQIMIKEKKKIMSR